MSGPSMTSPTTSGSGAVTSGLGLVGVAIGGASVAWLVGTSSYDLWGAAVIAPALLVLSLPIFHRMARETDDDLLFLILVCALLVQFAGALLRYYTSFVLYGGSADAGVYHQWGVQLSTSFRQGSFDLGGLRSGLGTDFIRILTGAVYTITGPTLLGGFMVFAWIAFWGQVLFYRAFVRAVPSGRKRRYALIVFFAPTLAFWPSTIGKEAWMVFTLGLAAYGVSLLFTDRPATGVLVAAAGLGLAALVRPHTAGLFAIAAAFGTVFTVFGRGRSRTTGPVIRWAVLLVMAVAASALVLQSQEFLADAGLASDDGVASTLDATAARTSGGGASFDAAVVHGPQDLPLAAVTVLFRPHLLEAHSTESRLVALEGLLLAGLALLAVPSLLRQIRHISQAPYVATALVYVGAFVVAFSSISNFGILARQRAQVLPLLAVLIALPRRDRPQFGPPPPDATTRSVNNSLPTPT
jgi:hypothetical protein